MLPRRSNLSCLAFWGLLAAALLCPSTAAAQVLYGSIVGNVKDPTAAAVPGATVTITSKETNQVRTAQTNEQGDYNFPTVQSGTYDVNVTKEGFRPLTQSNVTVSVNSISRADITMQLGSVSEAVSVSAQAAQLQTDSANVRAEITTKTLTDVPVPPGRNYQNLFITLPGFTPPANAHSIPSNPSRALTFNVNGTTRSSVNIRIDGASATNVWLPHIASYVPALESIETVNVVTNSFSPEQGLAGGASVGVQIRSGTNELHGALFEYHSNNNLKAKNFFLPAGQDNPKLVNNQFGGRLGGKIIRDKLFYFASYEGTYNRQLASRFATVPTAAMRRGDLSATDRPIYDPLTGDDQGRGRTAFAGNVIPQNRISPISQRLINLLPLPNLTGTLQNNYFVADSFLFDRDTLDTKVNYNVNSKLTTYARVSYLNFRTTNNPTFGQEILGPGINGSSNVGQGNGNTLSTTFAGTYVASATFVVDAYFGYTKMNTSVEQPRLDENVGRDLLGIPNTNGTRRFEGGLPTFAVNNFTAFGSTDNFMPYDRRDPQYQYVANANWTRGAHQIRFGVDYYRLNLNHLQPEFAGAQFGAAGGFGFAGGPTQISGGASANEYNSIATFLLGLPTTSGRLLQVPDRYLTQTSMFSSYIRDQWNVNRKLTVTYGTRYEFFPFPSRGDRGLERYDFNTNQMLICGQGDIPKDCGTSVSKLNFAPSLGLAYRPTDAWVVRAGFGLNWDPWNIARSLRTNFPVLIVQNLNSPNAFTFTGRTLAEGLPAIPPPDPNASRIPVPASYAVITTGDEFRRSYILSWNATVQRQLPGNFVGQVGYVATRQVRQLGNLDLNAGQVIGAGNAGRPLNPRFGKNVQAALVTPIGHSSYNALQSTLERRFSNGVSLNVAYTWSKAMGVCCNDNSDGGPAIQALPFYDLNRSLASFDRTHNLQITGIFELPFGRGKPFLSQGGVLSALAGGWQVNTVTSAYSGTPFIVGSDGASLNLPGSTQRADQVKVDVVKLGGAGRGQAFYDWTAYRAVTDARFGNSGFNSLRGPRQFNSDLGLFRRFGITERVNLEFRAEAFNWTNTPRFNNPSSNVSNLRLNPNGTFQTGFMEITSTAGTGREGIDERLFRFGLRLQF